MASTAASYNPTRDDFAAMLDESFAGGNLQESSVIKGKVVAIEKDMAVIDVGLKTEGRVALREFAGPGRESDLKVGDEVEVFLDRIENALGEAVLSRDKARREESWGKLEKAFNNNEKVHGVIFNQVKGGFTVDLDGAVAFLPRSQVDIRPIRDVAPLMNNSQPFQILKMDRRRGNIVVSRRTVLEETRAEQRQELVQNLEEGQVIDGVVKNITDYGAFVDLGGIDGLLHVTDIAWRRVNHPTEVLTIGQTVEVKIIQINHETHRSPLGMKQLLGDPLPVLEDDVDGMGHLSDLDWKQPGEQVIDNFKKGDRVKAIVLDVDVEKERISLGVKQLEGDPFAEPGDVKKGAVVTCEVLEVKEGGIEVQIAGTDFTTFIKRSELARDRNDQRSDRFAVGEKVDARVIQFDKKARKVQVSIKALEVAEEKEAIAQYGSSDSGATLGDILGTALKGRAEKDK